MAGTIHRALAPVSKPRIVMLYEEYIHLPMLKQVRTVVPAALTCSLTPKKMHRSRWLFHLHGVGAHTAHGLGDR